MSDECALFENFSANFVTELLQKLFLPKFIDSVLHIILTPVRQLISRDLPFNEILKVKYISNKSTLHNVKSHYGRVIVSMLCTQPLE
jgi:hypothetical protein